MTPVEKTAFLEYLRSQRSALDELVAQFPPGCLDQPGAAGDWSVKDIIAHLTVYEAWLVSWLEAALRGQLVEPTYLNDPDLDKRNAIAYAENRARPVGEVLEESRRNFTALLRLVERFSQEDLNDPGRTAWFVAPYWGEPQPLWDCIAGDSVEHYDQHFADLRAWLEKNSG